MNTKELKTKTIEELKVELLKQYEEQFKLRIQKATGQLAQSHLILLSRRNVARIKTLLNEKAGK